ncbi:MAG: lactate utilization protein [Candidatus Dojkabacteria bacterium]
MKYDKPVSKEHVEATMEALKESGINSIYVKDQNEAKSKIKELIPEGAEIMTMTSTTLDQLGIAEYINESGKYNSVRAKLMSMDRAKEGKEMNRLGAAPEYTIGSVHAVTQDGKVVIASNTGSQLPAYVYAANKVIWVVGTQKIVKNLDEALDRIYSYVLPLESERAHQAYGVPGSNVSKLLIVNKEIVPDRITVIFIDEALGF